MRRLCGVFAESGTPHAAHRICFIIMSPSSHRLIFDAFHHSDIRFARLNVKSSAKFDSQLVAHECKKILRDCAANRVHNQNSRNFSHVAEGELVDRRRREREKKRIDQVKWNAFGERCFCRPQLIEYRRYAFCAVFGDGQKLRLYRAKSAGFVMNK